MTVLGWVLAELLHGEVGSIVNSEIEERTRVPRDTARQATYKGCEKGLLSRHKQHGHLYEFRLTDAGREAARALRPEDVLIETRNQRDERKRVRQCALTAAWYGGK